MVPRKSAGITTVSPRSVGIIMKIVSQWPKGITSWRDNQTLFMSVPFTWLMPKVQQLAGSLPNGVFRIVVGGPGAKLANHFYPHLMDGLPVELSDFALPGVLQTVNPQATRTTTGCANHCPWCAVPILEPGGLQYLDDWPDQPVVIDNNITGASIEHFDKVMDRLERHGWCDFNQGVDARLLNSHHAERMARIKQSMIRLALDRMSSRPSWDRAYELLRAAGVTKQRIRSYVLVGFDSDPGEAWVRCSWVSSHGVKPLPMWYHPIDTLEHNIVTPQQRELGWTDYERRRLFQWFYQHKQAVKNNA